MDHLSYSQINEYLTCSRSYRHKYIEQVATPDNDALLFGSAWHKMISMGLVDDGGFYGSFPFAFGDLENDALFDLGYEMLNKNHSILQGLRPLAKWHPEKPGGFWIDHYIEFTVPHVDMPVIGYIDMIAHDRVPVDFKTASRKWSQDKADNDLQPTFYLAGLHAQGFIKAQDFPAKFRYIIFVKRPPYEVQILETTRTASDVINLFGLIEDCYRAIQHKIFLPNGVGSWKCSETYCDFWNLCMGGKRNETQS